MALLMTDLPVGLRFKPTDTDLVEFYLRRRATAGAAACAFPPCLIQELDIYTTEPWNLPKDSFMYQGIQKDMYFFTPRHRTSASSQRARRTAGCGFWLGSGKDEHIEVGSRLIGHKTQLTFVIFKGNDKKKKINTGWIMHEFRLHAPPSSSNKSKFVDLVLCRIHFKNNTTNNKRWEEDSGVVSIAQQQQQDTYADFALSLEQQLEEVEEEEEDKGEGRLQVKRRRVEEDCSMADSNNETGTSEICYTESSGQSAPLLPLSFFNMVSMVFPAERRELASMASDVAYVASAVGEREALETEERLLKRRWVEEPVPELQQRLMARADTSEPQGFAPESTDMAAVAAAAASVGEQEQIEMNIEERQLERRWQVEEHGVENTGSTSYPSQFNTDCDLPASLYCTTDLGSSFPSLDKEFSASSSSSSFLGPPTTENPITDYYYPDSFNSLAVPCWDYTRPRLPPLRHQIKYT